MKGTENYYSLSGAPHCSVTVNPTQTFEVAYPAPAIPILTVEKQSPPLQGDRVHALPYWSRVTEAAASGDGLVKFQYIWHLPGLVGDLPPTVCIAKQQAGSRIMGSFDAWELAYRLPASWLMPDGTPAQWKFAEHMANTKAKANLNKALVNLPLLYAERAQTAKMIGDRVGQVVRAAQAAHNRDFSAYKKAYGRLEKRKVAREAANSHLELIFGLLPMIDEVEGLAELLAMPTLDFIRARGTYAIMLSETPVNKVELVKTPSDISGVNSAGLVATVQSKGSFRNMISVRTALRYKLETQLAADARRLGFEPLGAAFDLYPLSFLLGWVSNLDDYIKGMAPLVGVTFETGSMNRRQRSILSYGLTVAPGVASGLYGNPSRWERIPSLVKPCDYFASKMANTRLPLSEPPESHLHWDVDVGLYEIAAGLSLTIQRYVKPLKRLMKQKSFRYRGKRPKWLPAIKYRTY